MKVNAIGFCNMKKLICILKQWWLINNMQITLMKTKIYKYEKKDALKCTIVSYVVW